MAVNVLTVTTLPLLLLIAHSFILVRIRSFDMRWKR